MRRAAQRAKNVGGDGAKKQHSERYPSYFLGEKLIRRLKGERNVEKLCLGRKGQNTRDVVKTNKEDKRWLAGGFKTDQTLQWKNVGGEGQVRGRRRDKTARV